MINTKYNRIVKFTAEAKRNFFFSLKVVRLVCVKGSPNGKNY